VAEKQRLDKILGNSGYGSRKEIKALVKQGLIVVDGQTVNDSGMQVVPEKSDIRIDGKTIEYKKYIYIMMNKPAGVISATFDKRLKTVLDILPEKFRKFEVFPAGRLDIDTEGLLLLTNDGKLAHEILSPRKHIPKTYYAQVRGFVGKEDLDAFEKGIILEDGYKCLSAQLKMVESSEISQIELTIYEGKFHQVKRMFEAVGKEVIYLKRVSMNELKLDNSLVLGESRELSEEELQKLLKK
jgi:16S rRNA pseudouridine516 synthase